MGQTRFLLQGHAVTLTFKVAPKMCATRHLNMVIILEKYL